MTYLLYVSFGMYFHWVKLTQGLLYYYGTVDLSILKKMTESYTNQSIEFLTYADVIDDAMGYYREITWSGDGYSNYRVFDSSQVIAEQHTRPTIASKYIKRTSP